MKINVNNDVVLQDNITQIDKELCFRGVTERLAVTRDVEYEYFLKVGHISPSSSVETMLALMNIALRHSQYINYEEVN